MQVTTTSSSQSLTTGLHFAEASSRLARNGRGLLSILGIASLLMISAPALAQTLGAAQSFAVLGGSAVAANGSGGQINGDVGIAPAAASAITGIPANATVTPPFVNQGNNSVAIAARAATLTLYNSLAGMGGATAILPGLNGQTHGPGTYSSGDVTLTSGTPLTLSGAGQYIFQVNSITTDVGSSVNLVGVDPCMVFWQVNTIAALNGTTFPGNIVAGTGVHLVTAGASLFGRALVNAAGDVTMNGGTVGGCSVQGAGGTPTLTRPVAPPDVVLGGSINDVKTLAGGAGTPQGTITFNLYGPNDTTCTGTVIFTSTVGVDGNGIYTSTPSYTPSVVGTYRWIANYSGDANNAATANACNATNESVIVTAAAVTAVTAIPTLSEWAMIMLAALLAIVGFAAMRRRAR